MKTVPALVGLAVAWVQAGSAVAGEAVYRSATANGLPYFTNEPPAPGAQPWIVFEPPRPAPRAWAAHSIAGKGCCEPELSRALREAVARHGIDEALLRAVIHVESGFNPRARSPAGAAGLMQLMPATAQRFGVTDRFDVGQNVQGGARYLRVLLDLFDGDLHLALAAYNAGEAAVRRFGNRVPPFPETRAYVPAVLERYRLERAHREAAAAPKAPPVLVVGRTPGRR